MNQATTFRCKSANDVALIQEVQTAAEAAMAGVIAYLKNSAEPNSEEAHRVIDEILLEHNCESPEGRIVASGQQSAEPHEYGSGPIQQGVPIVIDIYPRSRETGWWADITRTVCLGAPTIELHTMHQTVLQALEAAVALIRPGVACREVYDSVRRHFEEYGYETGGEGAEFVFAYGFVHGLGHNLGQAVHEKPSINAASEAQFMVGDVFTIEPGLYYPAVGGVRLENLYWLSESGLCCLTQSPMRLQIT